MNETQVRALLAIAVAYDNRRPSEANITAWWEAADRSRWDFDAAREAIHQHYAGSTDFLMPGHITAIIASRRGLPPKYVPRELDGPGPAADPRVKALIDQVARRLGWNRGRQSHNDAALVVECPYCHAQPKRPCTRLATRGPHRGEHVPLRASHPSRTEIANAAA